MVDKRIILYNRLIGIGINKINALTIALDAGGSQVIVNKNYLLDMEIPIEDIENTLKEISIFYHEELFEEDTEE